MEVDSDNQVLEMATCNGLPRQHENVFTILNALGGESSVFTLEIVKSRLLQEEYRTDMHLQNDQTESALFNSGA